MNCSPYLCWMVKISDAFGTQMSKEDLWEMRRDKTVKSVSGLEQI